MLHQLPDTKINFKIEFDTDGQEIRSFVQSFIDNYNKTWDCQISLNDLKEKDPDFYQNAAKYLEQTILNFINDEISDEFLNHLNIKLNQIKNNQL